MQQTLQGDLLEKTVLCGDMTAGQDNELCLVRQLGCLCLISAVRNSEGSKMKPGCVETILNGCGKSVCTLEIVWVRTEK